MLHIFLNIFKIPHIEPKYQIFYENTKYQALYKIPVLANLVFKIPIWQPFNPGTPCNQRHNAEFIFLICSHEKISS